MMLPQGNPPGVFPPTPIKKKSPIVWVLVGCGTILALGGVAGAVAVWWGYNKAKSYAEGALETGTGEMKTAAQLGGCVNVNEATFCSFQKQQAGKTTGLLIIAADDPQQKATMLYFIRSEGAAASDAG